MKPVTDPNLIAELDQAASSVQPSESGALSGVPVTDPELVRDLEEQSRGFLGNLKQSALSGLETTEDAAAALAATQGALAPETAAKVIKDRRFVDPQFQRPRAVDDFGQQIDAGDYWGAIKTLVTNPSIIPYVGAEGLGTSVLPLVTGAVGVGAGALTPAPGAAPVGGMIGLGTGSGAVEAGATILETMHEAGVDLNDEAAIAAALQDKALMDAALDRGIKKGIAVGAFDAASAGLAGRFLSAARNTLPSRAVASAKELGVQAAAGGAGEATGQIVTEGKVTKPSAVAFEAIGEIGGGAPEVVAGTLMRRRPAPSTGGVLPQTDAALQVAMDQADRNRAETSSETRIRMSEVESGAPEGQEVASATEGASETGQVTAQESVGPPDASAPGSATSAGRAPAPSRQTSDPEEIQLAAADVEPEPSDAKKEAGNYRKGHIAVHGMDVSIETAQGQERTGTDPNGEPWRVTMPAHYGYIRRTEGADGEQVDVYVGPRPEAQHVFVIDQIDADSRAFDEHKVMAGFEDFNDAMRTYDAGFSDGRGPERRGAVTPMTIEDFREWLESGDTQAPVAYESQPLTESTGFPDSESQVNQATDLADPSSGFEQYVSGAERIVGELEDAGGGQKLTVGRLRRGLRGINPAQARRVIDRLRSQGRLTGSGLVPKKRKTPETVLDIIKSMGGIQPSGETRAMDLQKARPGLVSGRGRTTHEIREHLEQAGILPEGSVDSAVYDLIDQQLKGGADVIDPNRTGEALDAQETAQAREGETQLAEAREQLDAAVAEHGFQLTDEEMAEIAGELAGTNRDPVELIVENQERKALAVEPDLDVVSDEEAPFDDIDTRPAQDESAAASEADAEGSAEGTAGAEPDRAESGDRRDGPRRTETTEAGEQGLIEGVEPVTDRDRIAAEADKPLTSDKTQQPADEGLFDTGARDQLDLVQQAQRPGDGLEWNSANQLAAAAERVGIDKNLPQLDLIEALREKGARSPERGVIEFPEDQAKSGYGSQNKIFTEDAADRARELLRQKLSGTTLTSGIDPEIMQAGITLAGYHVEAGARSFADFAGAIIRDMGEGVRPYLKSWYNALRDYPGFDAAGMTPYDEVAAADVETIDAPSSNTDLESPGRGAAAQDALGEADVPALGTTDDERLGGREPEAAVEGGQEPGRQSGLFDDDAAPLGEPGDRSVRTGASGARGSTAGGRGRGRGGADRVEGPLDDGRTAETTRKSSSNAAGLKRKRAAQAAAEKVPYKASDLDNIRETLPFLREAQQEDVFFAEQRFAKPDGHGVMFTNGTGTGKTFTGLGIIKRFARQGKNNILIVVPSQDLASVWSQDGKNLGLDISVLKSTQDKGKGIVATTYANFGENRHLADRDWDLVVTDESQQLMASQDAKVTDALRHFRAVTNHPRYLRDRGRMIERKRADEIEALRVRLKSDVTGDARLKTEAQMERAERDSDKLDEMMRDLDKRLDAHVERFREQPRGKAVFLSATPFAHVPTVDYAEGYLFEYREPKERGGYNQPDGHAAFFIEHFGYRMRTGKLTKPEADVNSEVMEREFHEWMRREGVLSGRMLDVDADYDRKFVLLDDAIGNRIDQLMDFLQNAEGNRYSPLARLVGRRFDYLSRRRLLEAMKAHHAVGVIKDHMALGRKVAVFHDYNEGAGFNPFTFNEAELESLQEQVWRDGKLVTIDMAALYRDFIAKNPDVERMKFANMRNPIETLTKAFPEALQYNGRVTPKKRIEAKAQFNEDGSGKDLIIVQSAAGEFGISLHDTTGSHQRVAINLGMPNRPVTTIQIEGRIYRTGQVSDAIFRYFNTGTSWERWAFAGSIAERSSTAENLAMGNQARALRQSFIDAFQDSDAYPASLEDGKGGKAIDRTDNTLSAFEKSKTFYWAQQKKRGRRDQREGVDYFATPEPVGFKMVEFADIKPGEKVLEPSAGHGAIARFFPESTQRTIIEPSSELASRAALASPGAKVLDHRFEDLHINNKYDAIVMNPPYGQGGKTAMDHLVQAMRHLRNGGRIVALLPRGPAADKRFDAWLNNEGQYENAPKGVYLVRNIDMPTVTFERAGTSVATRIVVLEKQTDKEVAQQLQSSGRDYSSIDKINDLFDRLEDAEIQPRLEPKTKEAEVNLEGNTVIAGGVEFELRDREADVLLLPKKRLGREVFARVAQLSEDHAGVYDRTERGFIFDTAESRQAFLEGLERGDVPKAATPTGEGVAVGFTKGQTVHGKTGADVFVATPAKRVERDIYLQLKAAAQKHGGHWSSYRGGDAIPGFQFESTADRDAFVAEMAGDQPLYAIDRPSPRRQGFTTDMEPPVFSYRNHEPLRAHADYDAAKAGDMEAAVRLVGDLVQEETLDTARQRFAGAVFAPVLAEERTGDNAIPGAMAAMYANAADGSVETEIYQANRAYHTGANAMERMIARPIFAGPVQQGARYVIVDDVTTLGGTLAEMVNHVRQNGGEVIGVITLANASRSRILAPTDARIREIERRYGDDVREIFDIDPAALTADEAQYVLNFRDADALRARATAAQRQRGDRLRAKGVPPSETEEGQLDRLDGARRGAVSDSGRLAGEIQDEVRELIGRLAPQLKRLEIVEGTVRARGIKPLVAGQYSRIQDLIRVSLAAKEPVQAARHEVIHHLRNIGMFTPSEWQALDGMARKAWMDDFDIEARYGDNYRERFGDQAEERLIEEAIADAFAQWTDGRLRPMNAVQRLFERIREFLAGMGRILSGRGVTRWEDVFGRIETGEVGSRRPIRADIEAAFESKDPARIHEALEVARKSGVGLTKQEISRALRKAGLNRLDRLYRQVPQELAEDLRPFTDDTMFALARTPGPTLMPARDRVQGTAEQEAAIKAVMAVEEPKSLREHAQELVARAKEADMTAVKQRVVDQFASIEVYEKAVRGKIGDAAMSAYKMARLTQNLQSTMSAVLRHGPLQYRNGGFRVVDGFDGGFEGIFEPLAENGTLHLWKGWAAAKRAQRLMAEGREQNFSQDQIDALLPLSREFPEFETVLERWQEFNRTMLDMAEASGLINAEQREIWEKDDYVPFYRVMEEDGVTGPRNRRGIAGQRSGIKKLTGSEERIGDIIENMVLNLTHLVDASFKNVAAQRVIDMLDEGGMADGDAVSAESMDWRIAHVKPQDAAKKLMELGVNVDKLAPDQKDTWLKLFTMVPPKDPDVISVMRDGKPVYYRVHDPLLLSSLVTMRPEGADLLMDALRVPKRWLTVGVTTMPGFMMRNFIRDTLHSWVVTGQDFIPFVDSAKGFMRSLREDPTLVSIMAAGGGSGGYYRNEAPDVRRQIDARLKGVDKRTLIDTPKKAFELWRRIGQASENANRLAVYEAAKKNGASDAEAAYQALNLLDFSMRGDARAVRFLIETIPFLNARLQGLHRMYRGARENPKVFMLRGGAIMSASLALVAANWDDERYDDLEEWEKDTYYHVFLDNLFPAAVLREMGIDAAEWHIRIPKPFEVGAIFSTVPERMVRAIAGKDELETSGKRLVAMFRDTFAVDAPQFMRPIIEQVANKTFFTDRPIVSARLQGLVPEAQYTNRTSGTARAIGDVTGLSPVRVDAFVQGYGGTIGMYLMQAVGAGIDSFSEKPPAPAWRPDRIPEIGGFVRNHPYFSTKYVTRFYELRKEASALYRTYREYRRQGRREAAAALLTKHAPKLRSHRILDRTARQLAKVGRQMQAIQDSTRMSPEKKRREMDRLQNIRNNVAKRVVQQVTAISR